MPKTSSITALAAASGVLLLLAGCSGNQSTSAACQQIQGELRSSVTQLQAQAAQLQSDPEGAAAKLQALDDRLAKSVEDVDNPEVKQKAETMEASFQDVVDQISAYAKDPESVDASKLTKATTKLQRDGEAFDAACKG